MLLSEARRETKTGATGEMRSSLSDGRTQAGDVMVVVVGDGGYAAAVVGEEEEDGEAAGSGEGVGPRGRALEERGIRK